jgi:RNA polymerase sigma-70 factor (ECF subfamily)
MRIYNFIKKQVREQQTTEDLTQEVFLRLFKSLSSFDPERQLSSYLYKIAVNEIRRYYQKAATQQTFSLNEPVAEGEDARERAELMPSADEGPEDKVSEKMTRRTLRTLIDRLPPEQKMVVLLKVYNELTFEEIAAVVDRPLSTVLSRMRYALQKLRRWMDQEGISANELPGNQD